MIKEDIEKAVIISYKNGVKVRDITSKLGVAPASISRILRRNQIPLKGKHHTPKVELQVVELYEAGMAITEIIDKTEVRSEQTIYRILRDANVTRRRNRE